MLTKWKVLLDEVERNERIAEAARQLVAALDKCDPGWRSNDAMDDREAELFTARDELVAAIEGGEK